MRRVLAVGIGMLMVLVSIVGYARVSVVGYARAVDVMNANTQQNLTLEVYVPHIVNWWLNDTSDTHCYASSNPAAVNARALDADNVTEYKFTVIVRHALGYDNILCLDIFAWYDEGDDATYLTYGAYGTDPSGHNETQPGGNRNLHLRWNYTGADNYYIKWPRPTSNPNGAEVYLGTAGNADIPSGAPSGADGYRKLSISFRPNYQFWFANASGLAMDLSTGYNDDYTWNIKIIAYDEDNGKYDEANNVGINCAASDPFESGNIGLGEFCVYKMVGIKSMGIEPQGKGRPGQIVTLSAGVVRYYANVDYWVNATVTDLVGQNTGKKIGVTNVSTKGGQISAYIPLTDSNKDGTSDVITYFGVPPQSPYPRNADGWFSNGSRVNENFGTLWRVNIPLGTVEDTYVGTITYTIEADPAP